MKHGTEYATRLRGAYLKMARKAPAAPSDGSPNPLRHLAIAVLGRHDGPVAGEHALAKLFRRVHDWNELRVSTPEELAGAVGGTLHQPLDACNRLYLALNGIYRRENAMSLDRLLSGKVKDSKKYLESLPGMDGYATAYVMLWSLGAHAIPVHDRLLTLMRKEEWVDPNAPREEVQAFLERHVKASDARRFCQVMGAYAEGSHGRSKPAPSRAGAVKKASSQAPAVKKTPLPARKASAPVRKSSAPRAKSAKRKAGK